MNEFLNLLTRWAVRVVLLMVGVVFFLSLLTIGCLMLALWGLRALWAKLTGQPVTPWVMPMRAASSWTSMYQRAGQFGAGERSSADDGSAPLTSSAGSKRGGVLAKVAGEVSDVQAREVS